MYCPAHTRYVAIKGLEGSYLVFDNFTFEEFTPPAAPSALAAADVTATSALITWTGETPMYYVRYKTAAKFAEDNANGCGGIMAGDPNDPQAPVRAFCLNFGGSSVETGITATRHMNVTNPNGAWHTLDGRRLSGKPTQRGIYINDGRKTVIE